VSAADVDELVTVAREAGALGAKLTGGGTGGAVLALAPDPAPITAALRARDVESMVVEVAA
jgi:mevalonate kinase